MSDFADLMKDVALALCGKPNERLSKATELRFGTNGSLSVKIDGPEKGTFYDHEEGNGGGVLDLIVKKKGGDKHTAREWLDRTFGLDPLPPKTATTRREVAHYDYVDEAGEVLSEVVRFEPKDFRQRRPDGKGGWIGNVKGVRQVPYRLPELLEALDAGRTVFVVEGEKDVDRLKALGIVATCNAGGAGKWKAEFGDFFRHASVVIIPDNDDAGRDHADMVARSLDGKADDVRVLDLPDLPRKGDVSDWLNAGGTAEALHRLVDIAPRWRPSVKTRLPFVMYGDEDNAPPLSWLVKGALVNNGLSSIFGGPGTSKTFLAIDLALCVAHGRDWFGRRVTKGAVVYVTGEGSSGLRQRTKAWRQENGGEPRVPFVMVPTSVNLFDDDTGADALISDVAFHAQTLETPVRLIVLDTLSRMIGAGDEDKAKDINVVVQRAERLQRETGAHVLIVHHSGKDRDRGMRGSNALLGAVDAAVEVVKHESGLCEASFAKVKDGGDLETLRYRLSKSVLGVDEDGEDITSCVVCPADANEGATKESGPRLTNAEELGLRALKEALAEVGQQGVTTRAPADVTAVTVETWREYAYRLGMVDNDAKADAKRQAFYRVRQKLQVYGIIGIDGDWTWIAKKNC
jgi:hypothetical protein